MKHTVTLKSRLAVTYYCNGLFAGQPCTATAPLQVINAAV